MNSQTASEIASHVIKTAAEYKELTGYVRKKEEEISILKREIRKLRRYCVHSFDNGKCQICEVTLSELEDDKPEYDG